MRKRQRTNSSSISPWGINTEWKHEENRSIYAIEEILLYHLIQSEKDEAQQL